MCCFPDSERFPSIFPLCFLSVFEKQPIYEKTECFGVTFAGILSFLLCRKFALKLQRHMSEAQRVCAAGALVLANVLQSLEALKL